MKAEFRAPMSKDRKPLIELLPLSNPLTMYIDPSNVCNFACKFCFQSNERARKEMDFKIMNMDIFNIVIEQLKEFNESISMIHLHGYGEPLMNKNFPEMVKLLKNSKCAKRVATTTNASLLNKDLALKIIDSNLDQIHISIYGLKDSNYIDFSNKKVDFETIVNNIKFMYENKTNTHMHIKINGDYYSDNDKKRFFEIFGDLCDTIFIDGVANIWPGINVEESLKLNLSKEEKSISKIEHQYGYTKSAKNKICPSIFYQLMIHSNGNVSPCCADYMGKLNLGNVKTTTLKSIWGGEERMNLIKGHLESKKPQICEICEYPNTASTVSLDENEVKKIFLDKF